MVTVRFFLCPANPKVLDNESSNVNRAAEGCLINRCHSDKWRRCRLNHILLVVCREYNFSRHVGSLFSTSSRTCLGITPLNKMHCFNINIRPTAYSFRFLNVLHSEYHTDNSPRHQLSNRRVIIDAAVKTHHVVVAVLIQQPSDETLPVLYLASVHRARYANIPVAEARTNICVFPPIARRYANSRRAKV